jgi:hypothetical protein
MVLVEQPRKCSLVIPPICSKEKVIIQFPSLFQDGFQFFIVIDRPEGLRYAFQLARIEFNFINEGENILKIYGTFIGYKCEGESSKEAIAVAPHLSVGIQLFRDLFL